MVTKRTIELYPWMKPRRRWSRPILYDKDGNFLPHRQPTFVITTGHEGSSAFMKILMEIGIFLGKEPHLARSSHKRFYEYKRVQHINRYILGARGYPYPFPLEDRGSRTDRLLYNSDSHLRTMHNKLVFGMISDGLEQDQPFAIKDPRTCLTFPVWKRAIPKCSAIFLSREESDTYKGWNVKGDEGYFWYKKYWHENYELMGPEKRYIVEYDALSNDFTNTVRGLIKWLRPHPRVGDDHIARAREWWKPKYEGVVRGVRG